MQQRPAAVSRDVDILESVIVIVADGAAEIVAGYDVESRIVRRFRESAMAVAFVEREFGSNEQDVEVAVVVEIQKSAAVADGLQDIQRALARDGPGIMKAGRSGEVLEVDGGRRRSLGRWRRNCSRAPAPG